MLRICVTAATFFAAFASSPAWTAEPSGDPCSESRDFDTLSIQRARALVKSSRFTTARDRASCGNRVIEALGPYTTSSNCDATCRGEYARLYLDHIQYLRKIAESRSPQVKKSAHEKEFAARQKFGEFLLDTKDSALIEEHWSENFDGLGDVMNWLGYGGQFHRAAMAASLQQSLSPKSYENWAFAIRSCNEWDFASGPNRNLDKLRKQLNCVDECQNALRTIRARVDQQGQLDKQLIHETLNTLLPTLEQCPRDQI